jgi:DNA adenine methylase
LGALLRYHGGKVRIASKLVSLFPAHEAYVEPFGGGAAVLLEKMPSRLEIYNDMDGDMVTFFRVLRDTPDALAEAIALTPWSRTEHETAYLKTDDDLECARRVLIRSHFGHGSSGIHRSTGFRGAGLRARTLPIHTWQTMPETIRAMAERMKCVVIENRPAIDVMVVNDNENAVHYVDPPYLPETRDAGRDYRHEMTKQDHADLLDCLTTLRGRVLLSGYASEMYDDALSGWRRVEINTKADKALDRTEVVWMNYADDLFQPTN